MSKWIYHFGANHAEGNAEMADILGSKGANLAEMSNLKLPIPQGFTITTDLCKYYYDHNNILPLSLKSDLANSIKKLEDDTGKTFGKGPNPLLVSVRSGSKASMPGMMDTILNLGINDEVMEVLALATGNKRFALDSYRRFLQMYGAIVLNIKYYLFEDIFENYKIQSDSHYDEQISDEILAKIIVDYKKIIAQHSGKEYLDDPYTQLYSAVEVVLKSWMSERAIIYRELNDIDESLGTAVSVQSMVFGNMGADSATGVVFTRSPNDGKKELFGEFIINAQGEDIVAGIRTPSPIISQDTDSMQNMMPNMVGELQQIAKNLELHYKDMQDIEFTIEKGKLYILQTRNGKRTAAAAIKIAVDMVGEGVITEQEAVERIEPESLNQLLHARIDYTKDLFPIAQGLPASPGAATGIVVFSPYDAEELSHHHKVILVRADTSPEDIKGMHVSTGVLTARGGMTSHAAVVARGMGKPCVCGVNDIIIDEKNKKFKAGNIVVNHGEEITIDGTTGQIFLGKVALIQPHFSKEFDRILFFADKIRTLRIRANAETPLDTSVALQFGAEGIGLCRTEHMFFDEDKIPLVREMIIAPDLEKRQNALKKLLPLQIKDFKELFYLIKGKPINIRLLDPPLHEFLPTSERDKQSLAESLNLPLSIINQRLHAMHEVNPMLGHRGCRLGITYPEIYQMQIEAIFTGLKELKLEEGIDIELELMIPLISGVNELTVLKKHILNTIKNIERECSLKFKFSLGTMIELPRSALRANDIAEEVDYFSFGTNDLTQTAYGISRDDAGSFMPDYLTQRIFDFDPFVRIDEEGVGELIKIAIARGKAKKAGLKFGVCGEHAGNPKSIKFFNDIGINYISCSPYRIPIARIAAAQAVIRKTG